MNTPLSGRFSFLPTNSPTINFELDDLSGLLVICKAVLFYLKGKCLQ
jgi:hypothetical protein